jgi:hypothetical protein
MKKISLFLVIFLCFIIAVKADNNDDENVLIARGYTKYYPRESPHLYQDAYEEIFNVDYRFQKTGIRIINLVIPNDFKYCLYYVLEKKGSPNILVAVFIETEEGTVGFYKKNLFLTGVKIQTV